MKFVDEYKNWKGKQVIMRVDFNVPIEEGDVLGEMWRIKASLPTIKFLLKNGVSQIVFLTHIGRPQDKIIPELSVKHLIPTLNKLLKDKIFFSDKFEVTNIKHKLVLMENLRFHIEERENDKNFAKKLASLGEIYVNDAFSVSHRAHASIDAITKFLPCFGGLEMKREIEVLTRAYNNFVSPLSVIIGGVKVGTKLKMIEHFLKKNANVIVGGALGNTLLHIKGIAIGDSVIDKNVIENLNGNGIDLTSVNLHLPIDAIVKTKKGNIKISAIGKINKGDMIFDIGPDTNELFANILKKSNMIIWNGPMGKFEDKYFEKGTEAIAKDVLKSKVKTIIGGGDTLAFLEQKKMLKKGNFYHISTGGGAMLDFLSGNKLPGIKALN
ncbi:MAG: phosphoglycerate kinase [Patescibacteria group bacterium]